MEPPERLNLRWDGYEANARLSFRKLRDKKEFFDVTVVADCGQQMEANKAVLAGASSFLHRILKEDPHPHSLIYLKGVGYKHLVYLLDFVYTGEASIAEDDLKDFLDIAEDLKVKGLTLETTANQTTFPASPPNQEAAQVSHPPRPHYVTRAAPAPHQDEVAAQEHAPSLRMLHELRPQSITSTCPAPHPSQVLAQEIPPPVLSQLNSVKSALPRDQVAANETVKSPSISKHCSSKSALPQVQLAANETVLSASISNPHSAKRALPQGQLDAKETAPSSRRLNPHTPKSVLPRGKLAGEKAVPSVGIQNLSSAISSHLSNALSQSSCVENHDNTFNIKVEVGDEHYNVVCGIDDHGEQYICHVSNGGLEEHGENIHFEEDIVMSAEQEKNDQVISTGKEPKEGIKKSSYDMVMREATDEVFEDEQMPHDWYEQGEESQNMILGQNKGDKNNMIPDGEKDLNGKTKSIKDMDLQCLFCSVTFTTSSQLRRHKKIHIGEKQFPHPVRSKMSSQMGSSNDQKSVHAGKEQVKGNHNRDKPNQCLPSSKKKSLRKNLNQHKMKRYEMSHTGKKPHQCLLCPKSFSQLIDLKRHNMTHTGEKPHQCLLCPKSFSRLKTLEQHNMTHTGEKPHQCMECPKSFSLLNTLKQHNMTHTGEKPHQCSLCPKSFSQLTHLKVHNMSHTGEKPHQCVECPKSFSQLKDLKRHNMTHTGEKPHQCMECPKSFSQLINLKVHKMTHTGEKPHQCSLCPKSFSQVNYLKRHNRTHTGEKPHQCLLCPKSFSRLTTLKKHNMTHTGEAA